MKKVDPVYGASYYPERYNELSRKKKTTKDMEKKDAKKQSQQEGKGETFQEILEKKIEETEHDER